jgi:hypothetical protein
MLGIDLITAAGAAAATASLVALGRRIYGAMRAHEDLQRALADRADRALQGLVRQLQEHPKDLAAKQHAIDLVLSAAKVAKLSPDQLNALLMELRYRGPNPIVEKSSRARSSRA